MTDVLCLDTDILTIAALKRAGHNVDATEFGYATGRRFLNKAPHDFDVIIFDLKQPACFDSSKWGPFTGNDNYRCTIIPQSDVTWESRRVSRDNGRTYEQGYRYRLIYETQIRGMDQLGSKYGPKDILNAVAKGGVPVLAFLNPEWVLRGSFPDFFELRWDTSEASITKAQMLGPLASVSEQWHGVELSYPVRCSLAGGPYKYVQIGNDVAYPTTPIVADRISSVLGECVFCEKGTIWLLPTMVDNAAVACEFVKNLSAITTVSSKPEPLVHTASVADTNAETTNHKEWDVFISYASEDASFTSELASALRTRGLNVWYDGFILKMGDQLTKKIDEGLTHSRFGIVVLSPSFFAKSWPEAELSALHTRQTSSGKKVILPVWLKVTRADVAGRSALLADLHASDASMGVEHVVRDVLEVVNA